MSPELKGKVAIVTGSSRGIGKAIALGLAGRGCRVVVTARTAEQGNVPGTIHETAEEVCGLEGDVLPIRCDVTDEASVQKMVDAVLAQWGEIHILINNAGVGSYLPFLETPVKVWDRIMAVNLRGTFLCTRAVLPHMVERRRGSILNISSFAANSVFSLTTPKEGGHTLIGIAYGLSKAGIERLTTGLAAEMGKHNIAVNAIKPARPVLTEALMTHLPQANSEEWATPDAMVRAAVFLAAQDATGVCGVVCSDEEVLLHHGL